MAKRILVVDDNDDLLALLAESLGDEGYEVVTCDRAREAYQTARETRPDLVLLDIIMPGMSGWEVLNVFLLDRTLRTVPVVLMTAAAPDVRRKLARLDIRDVSILDKPFSLDRLLEQVEVALGRPSECEMLYEKLVGGDKLMTLVTPLPQPEAQDPAP